MLYILSKSPSYCNFSILLNVLNNNDDLILIQDGILAGLKYSIFIKKIIKIQQDIQLSVYALKNDILARGLENYISKQIIHANYKQFVYLTVKHKQQILW
ncbi:sulfurtransferase complex subunit TusB [Enterobacteriaceae endosymbiont of Neohaemonia nigricornis]|uniref:sulfurtransferase complex subunit TusB n=1 Tax=Enterobacteriaceae endosymbiont of Neohaemonia nigricornis TaxID=2675792 RepID=UPI0014492476|nr:sulfurtransferase complex subunit TusB [Enterobacteriaceae endosymbiont of Neohaemonia nigricornis]QJC30515.1 sulfurtransferase complex subunit TusB [Enterobacteriaceae endosymbiont of Neohaemonia nigricornis]